MRHTTEEKHHLVMRYRAGESVTHICSETGIALSTFYSLVKPFQTTVTETGVLVTPQAFDVLRRKVEKQAAIIQVLKSVNCTISAPLKEKLEALEPLYGQFSAHTLCDALEVSRGTFYNHIFRRADRTAYFQEQQALMLQVQQVFEDSKQRYGAQKICAVLGECGIHVGAKRNYKKRQAYKKQDLLRREFTASRMNEIWASDITCFKVNRQPMYLCVIIDLFSRRVVSYRVSQKQSTQLVTFTLPPSKKKKPTAETIPLPQIFAKAQMSTSDSTMRYAPIRPWHIKLQSGLRSCTGNRKHKTCENPGA